MLVLGIDSEPYPDDGLTFARTVGLHYASVIDEHNDVNGQAEAARLSDAPTSSTPQGIWSGTPQAGPFTSRRGDRGRRQDAPRRDRVMTELPDWLRQLAAAAPQHHP